MCFDNETLYYTATLYVPGESLDDRYRATAPWSKFANIIALEETGIENNAMGDNAPTVDAIFSIDGKRMDSMKHGLNIVRMSDGTTRKVMK